MQVRLGTNLGFAINRYIEPEEWARIIGEKLELRHVQMVADLINPFWPKDYLADQIKRIKVCVKNHHIQVDSIFTSSFTRVNHLLHPDPEARKFWLQWFKELLNLGAELGVKTGGSHFGILTFASWQNSAIREALIEEGVKSWQELSFHAANLGYENLVFEPMSVPREMANTIEDTIDLLERVNSHCGIPLRVCLDIGHAPHPKQRNPYPWIERLGSLSPIIHLQQTPLHKSQHWPFTAEYNQQGIIHPPRVLDALTRSGAKDVLLLFEISHREHWDTDFRIIDDLKASVDYWRPFVND